jgi:hypothetical protein
MTPLPRGIRRAFRLAARRPRIDEEVDAEVAFHLEMRAAELVARGMTPEAARAEARRRFGDTDHWSLAMSAEDRERAARERRAEWLDDLRQDLRYGARALRRAPLFTLLAVVTLALGIGANAAVFGVVKSVLLDALPYGDAGRLVRVYTRFLDGSSERAPLSPAGIADLAQRSRSFARLAAFNAQPSEAIYAEDGEPHVARLVWAEPQLFRTLGVPAAREREFGVRVVLGSSPRAIAGLVLRQGAVWIAPGLAAGAAGVVLAARLVRGLLYGVAPFDPVALGAAVVLLLACAAVALLVPVRRATRVDPITVLR